MQHPHKKGCFLGSTGTARTTRVFTHPHPNDSSRHGEYNTSSASEEEHACVSDTTGMPRAWHARIVGIKRDRGGQKESAKPASRITLQHRQRVKQRSKTSTRQSSSSCQATRVHASISSSALFFNGHCRAITSYTHARTITSTYLRLHKNVHYRA